MTIHLGNRDKMEVHYLPNEQKNCKLSKIKPEHEKFFDPDTLQQAHAEGYDNCRWCLGNSRRLS